MIVYAANLADPNINPLAKFGDLGVILNVVIPLLTTGAGLLFLVMLVYGAFMYLQSGGKAENIKKAQSTLTFAIIGFVIVLCSYLIIKLIGVIFQIQMPF